MNAKANAEGVEVTEKTAPSAKPLRALPDSFPPNYNLPNEL